MIRVAGRDPVAPTRLLLGFAVGALQGRSRSINKISTSYRRMHTARRREQGARAARGEYQTA
jgi:hypothetical protein